MAKQSLFIAMVQARFNEFGDQFTQMLNKAVEAGKLRHLEPETDEEYYFFFSQHRGSGAGDGRATVGVCITSANKPYSVSYQEGMWFPPAPPVVKGDPNDQIIGWRKYVDRQALGLLHPIIQDTRFTFLGKVRDDEGVAWVKWVGPGKFVVKENVNRWVDDETIYDLASVRHSVSRLVQS